MSELEYPTRLRKKWGDKPCDHPNLESECLSGKWIGGVPVIGGHTSDKYCTQCGEIFFAPGELPNR